MFIENPTQRIQRVRYRKILIQKSSKFNFSDQTIKNSNDEKRQLEYKESSSTYEMEAVEFVDNINVDSGDFDDNVIDYIAESIYSCYIFN